MFQMYFRDLERSLLENVVENTDERSWEMLYGSLGGLKILTEKRRISPETGSKIEIACLNLLNHDEARVRLAAGSLIFAVFIVYHIVVEPCKVYISKF
jgi:hypothetical protein